MKKMTSKIFCLAAVLFCAVSISPVFAAKKGSENKQDSAASSENAGAPQKTAKAKKSKNKTDENPFRAHTVEKTCGNVKYLVKGAVGSLQLYSLGKNGSQVPLFAGYDEFTSSFISVLAGKKEYKLTNNIGIVIGARPLAKGIQMVYVVPDVARVLLTMETVETDKKVIGSEIVKVSLSLTNKQKRSETFALKTVYDTVLGEQFGPHFSTSEEIAINSERQFRRFDKVNWVKSESQKAKMQFLFGGADITDPEIVSLSNKDVLALTRWVPQIVSSRTFDSVLSYNNSAVCMNWQGKVLAPEEKYDITYYIAIASDEEVLDGDKYIRLLENEIRKKNGLLTVENDEAYIQASALYAREKYREAYDVVCDAWVDEEKRTPQLASLKNMIEKKLGVTEENQPSVMEGLTAGEDSSLTDAASAPVEVQTPSASAKNIDAAYVQKLLEKIQALEEDSENVDRKELLKLNEELDAVLNQLEQQ